MNGSWWKGLQVRERRALTGGGVVLVIVLVWAFVWHPLAQARSDMATYVKRQRADVVWMRQAAARARELRLQGPASEQNRQGKSLLALADVSARGAGLADALKRVEPTGSNSVRVTFEIANFDALANWLEALARDYGVRVSDLSVDKVRGIGLVNARVTLQDSKH